MSQRTRGKAGARGVALTFLLDRPTQLELLVRDASPACRPLGLVALGRREGMTTIRFFGRLEGRLLPAGRYALVVRGRGAGTLRELGVVPIRVVRPRGGPPAVLRAPGAVPACVAAAEGAAATVPPALGGVESARTTAAPPARAPTRARARSLAERVVDTIRPARDAPAWVKGLLLAFVVLILLTVTLAFVPPRLFPAPLARVLAAWREIRSG